MGWIYHTNITPREQPYDSFNIAFDTFLNQCLIHKDRLVELLDKKSYFRFVIRTDGDNDKIINSDGNIYLKSIFLTNKTFKKKLIDYYRPLGIYVKGPDRIDRRDGTTTHRWMIELRPSYQNLNSRFLES